MKIQDLFFAAVLGFLLYKKDSRLFLIFGLGSLVLSIPLFYFQIFFTAQRLVYYGFAFILIAVVFMIFKEKLA